MRFNKNIRIIMMFSAFFVLSCVSVYAMSVQDTAKASRSYYPILLTTSYGGSFGDVKMCAAHIKIAQKKKEARLKAQEEKKQKDLQKNLFEKIRVDYQKIVDEVMLDKNKYQSRIDEKYNVSFVLERTIPEFEKHVSRIKKLYGIFLDNQKQGLFSLLGDDNEYVTFNKECADLLHSLEKFLHDLTVRYDAQLKRLEKAKLQNGSSQEHKPRAQAVSHIKPTLPQEQAIVVKVPSQRTNRNALFIKINTFLENNADVAFDSQNKEAVLAECGHLLHELNKLGKIDYNYQSMQFNKIKEKLERFRNSLQIAPQDAGNLGQVKQPVRRMGLFSFFGY